MPKLAARLLGAYYVAVAQTILYMAAAHRIFSILARQAKPTTSLQDQTIQCGVSTDVVRHLMDSVGSTAPVREHRWLNSPKGIVRGLFLTRTPFSKNVWGHRLYRIFRFVGKAGQVLAEDFDKQCKV